MGDNNIKDTRESVLAATHIYQEDNGRHSRGLRGMLAVVASTTMLIACGGGGEEQRTVGEEAVASATTEATPQTTESSATSGETTATTVDVGTTEPEIIIDFPDETTVPEAVEPTGVEEYSTTGRTPNIITPDDIAWLDSEFPSDIRPYDRLAFKNMLNTISNNAMYGYNEKSMAHLQLSFVAFIEGNALEHWDYIDQMRQDNPDYLYGWRVLPVEGEDYSVRMRDGSIIARAEKQRNASGDLDPSAWVSTEGPQTYLFKRIPLEVTENGETKTIEVWSMAGIANA